MNNLPVADNHLVKKYGEKKTHIKILDKKSTVNFNIPFENIYFLNFHNIPVCLKCRHHYGVKNHTQFILTLNCSEKESSDAHCTGKTSYERKPMINFEFINYITPFGTCPTKYFENGYLVLQLCNYLIPIVEYFETKKEQVPECF